MIELLQKINGPAAVIGDIHGHTDKLSTILEKLLSLPDAKSRTIVLIGDLVDRGPDPKGTMDLVLDVMREGYKLTAVCGNHDYAMMASLGLLPQTDPASWASRWTDHYDSETTFESYGVPHRDMLGLRRSLPIEHVEFLQAMPWCVEHPQFIFVHAGLDPFVPLDLQLKILRQKDFTLNRPQWLYEKNLVHSDIPAGCTQTVVSGHVCVPQVVVTKTRILCDTTGGLNGNLSCVLLPEKKIITSDRSETSVTSTNDSKSRWKLW